METRAPLPPFTLETASQKVRLAEDAWNTRDPGRVVLAYSEARWRNRAEFPVGRAEVQDALGDLVVKFVRRRELDYRLIKELWTFGEAPAPSETTLQCASPTKIGHDGHSGH